MRRNMFDKLIDKFSEGNHQNRNCKITICYYERLICRLGFRVLKKNTLIKLKALLHNSFLFEGYNIHFIFYFY